MEENNEGKITEKEGRKGVCKEEKRVLKRKECGGEWMVESTGDDKEAEGNGGGQIDYR